ncbi:hypothetical protein ACWIB8_05295 [Corynebacterium flavescens]
MDTSNWIAVVAAFISAAGFALSLWQAKKAANSESDATNAAAQSASSAKESAASQERIAEALEKLNSRYPNPWKVEHLRGDLYIATNDSDEPALNVELETDSPISSEKIGAAELSPGSQLQFMYAGTFGSNQEMTIRWTRPSESKPRVWRGSVPG